MTSVKVRIAVAVRPDGMCYASLDPAVARGGWHDAIVHWVTAELPIPEPVEVAGSVEAR